MEQLRVALDWMAKYHFWLISGGIVLISSLSWWMGSGDLTKRKIANEKKVAQAHRDQQNLINRQLHPSKDVNNRQEEQNKAIAEETKDIWQELYDRQRSDALQWPSVLPDAFLATVKDLRFGAKLDKRRRENYTNYIRQKFDELPELIDANEMDEKNISVGADFGGGGRFGGASEAGYSVSGGTGSTGGDVPLDEDGNPIEIDYTVYWSPEDQLRIATELDWLETQSHWRIWVTQEDLWVYEAILRAIANTNTAKGSDRVTNAAVAEINALQVGRDAAEHSRTPGRIKAPAAAVVGEGTNDQSYNDQRGQEDLLNREDYGPGATEPTPAEEKQIRLSGRYIDAEGKPIEVLADEEPLEPGAFGQEVKRLPVRIVVRMDARWLSMLITELANADLQIQVTEVRIGEGLSENSNSGYMGVGAGEGRGSIGEGVGYATAGEENILAFDRKPYMKPVIIQGVVLIFNQPDQSILGGNDSDPEYEI